MQVLNAMAADAAALLIANTDDTGFMRLELSASGTAGAPAPAITIPAASMPRNSGLPLRQALINGQRLTVRFALSGLPAGDPSFLYFAVPPIAG